MKKTERLRKKLHMLLCLALAFVMLAGMLPAVALTASAAQTEGTFTAVSMNVDGLPNKISFITINSDGPGSDGTKKISAKLAEYGWDIIGVAEDFNYNTELMSSLTDYNSGTHRGGVSGLSNDTDGLNLIWKNSITVTGEKWTSWNTHYSTGIFGTGNGADGMIDKGYRFYQATIAEGVTVDVYILHMDADSDAGDIAARESQLTQLAKAIKDSKNGNPIIVMGDTNCRYTRENLKTLFIDAINEDDRFTIQDAWIEKVREGDYPAYGADAIVAKDKGGTYDYPEAEIVDKVFYINNSDSKVTLTANSYTIASDFTDSDGTALADHWPVVVEFAYSVAEDHTHIYTETVTTEPTCVTPGVKTFTCSCGDSYTETISALGHSYTDAVIKEATCTEAGEKTYTCANCGDSYTEAIPALGHSYTDAVTKEATCTEAGEKTYTCANCGDSYTEAIPALGHSYAEAVTKEATCTETGEKTYTCANCGGSYTEVIPAIGHLYEQTESKVVTCTEDGYETYVCSHCGDSYQVVEKALGHSYENGICVNCGENENPSQNQNVLGEEVKSITSGEQYVVVFTGSTGAFDMSRDGKTITAGKFALAQGDLVEDTSIWTITEKNKKYIFSTQIDGETYYLYRSKTFTGSGYKLSLITNEASATEWTLSTTNLGSLRFSVQPGFASYYLRYYNANIGWEAAFSSAGVHLYKVVEG